MSDGFDPSDLLIDSDDDSGGVVSMVTSFLGIQREAHVCPECNTGCVESMTYDAGRAAFSGGESPSWECPECGSHYVREDGDEGLTLDLYGRE